MPFDQGWHRDSYRGVQRVRHHPPRWLLCMYYPAAVTLEMGPTAIAPGSQYYALPADGDGSARPPAQPIRHDQIDDPEGAMQEADLAARDRLLHDTIGALDPSVREEPMVVPAGSFCCFHYDMYHRRMRRHPASDSRVPPRIVFRFLFTSGAARTAPSWAHGNEHAALPWDAAASTPPALAAAIWSFMTGNAQDFTRSGPTSAELVAALRGGDREAQRMDAAYRMARAGRAGSDESVRRLVAALRAVVECCVTCLKRPEPGGGTRAAPPRLPAGLDTRERAHVAAERSPRAAHARQSRGGRRCAPSGSSRRLQVISQRLGRLIEVDEQEAGPTLQPQRYQSVVRGVEVGGLLHPAHTDEVAVGAIGPCVVGADDGGTVPFARQETTPRCRHVLARRGCCPLDRE